MKNLLIVFPGGCGGNHLANLISFNNKFTPRFKSSNYHQELLNQYKEIFSRSLIDEHGQLFENPHGITAHFSKYHHLDQLKKNSILKQILNSKTINILIGHEHDYEEFAMREKILNKIPNPFWIVMSYPKINSIPYNRIQLYKFTPKPEKYTYPYYVFKHDKDAPVLDESNSLLFETEKFFAIDGCDYIKNQLTKINVELHDLAYEIHDLWYKKLIEVLTLYNAMPTKYSNECSNIS